MSKKNNSMSLGQLLNAVKLDYPLDDHTAAIEITGLVADSRYCEKGNLFFAREGDKQHGLDFIDQVIDKGAAYILYEGDYNDRIPDGFPASRLDNQTNVIRQLATDFYGAFLESIALVGVTGTEGKTSVTQFVAKALKELAIPCGVIGTNGMGYLSHLIENAHTTPDQLTLYQYLVDIGNEWDEQASALNFVSAKAEQLKGKPITLEVTSHALDQKRIEGLKFAVTALTNLSRDHLDYHGTIEAYAVAKKKLFTDYPSQSSVLNIEDPFGLAIMDDLLANGDSRILYPYGEKTCNHPNYLQMRDIELKHDGLQFYLHYQSNQYLIDSPLYGRFNAYNLTAAIGILLGLGLTMNAIIPVIATVGNVRGRMERVALKNGAVGIVDYAHKPNALLQALTSLRAHLHDGKLTAVFGCGGDRDRGKRAIMAKIAEEHADQVIVTSDNPRTEDPEAIIDEIMDGFSAPLNQDNIIRISDRADAIRRAIDSSKEGDIILIAGKGHEDYQIIGNQTIHFSDLGELERYNREQE